MVALTLNTNMSSMNAQRHLDSVQAELGDTIDRIATGVKIHDAKDGGAELTLTENIRADILALDQGAKNLKDYCYLKALTDEGDNTVSASSSC